MAFIQRAFRGEERLWKVWWLGGFVVSASVFVWSRFVVVPTALASGNAGERNAATALFVLGLGVALAWAAAEWRCAFNVNWRGWGWIARIWLVVCLALSLPIDWYAFEMIRGNVPPEYGPLAAALWTGPRHDQFLPTAEPGTPQPAPVVTGPSTGAELAQPGPNEKAPESPAPSVRYLDAHWQKVALGSGESTNQIYAVYAGRPEKAEIGLANWSGSVSEFGGDMAAQLVGFERVGKPGQSSFRGSAVWATQMKGLIRDTPYFAALYALRDKDGKLCWVLAVTTYPVDPGFYDRSWQLAQAVGAGEYPRYPASTAN